MCCLYPFPFYQPIFTVPQFLFAHTDILCNVRYILYVRFVPATRLNNDVAQPWHPNTGRYLFTGGRERKFLQIGFLTLSFTGQVSLKGNSFLTALHLPWNLWLHISILAFFHNYFLAIHFLHLLPVFGVTGGGIGSSMH